MPISSNFKNIRYLIWSYFFNLQQLSKENRLSWKFRTIFNGLPFYCQELPDNKILLDGKTLKEFWISFLKNSFLKKIFDESHVNVGKIKIQKIMSSIFHVWFIVKKMFLWSSIATILLSFAHRTDVDKEKYLIFLKLETLAKQNVFLAD